MLLLGDLAAVELIECPLELDGLPVEVLRLLFLRQPLGWDPRELVLPDSELDVRVEHVEYFVQVDPYSADTSS